LTDSFGLVAVVSGRPVSFLVDRLGAAAGVILIGLYGLERAVGGRVETVAAAEAWRPVVAGVVERLEGRLPAGVRVESKGLTVTVHWRNSPDSAHESEAQVLREATDTGLEPHSGRMSVELRPPLLVDKGTVVAELVQGRQAGCFLGDDLGDLPAFAAIERWSASEGTTGITVAATDPESAHGVVAAAQLVVDGPPGALRVLRWLADAAEAASRGGPDGGDR
jgi:trehalose 6-phosphate phosphatase